MLTNTVEDLLEQGRAAREASRILARLSGNVKNQALLNIAEALETQQDDVLEANEADCRLAKADGISESVLERLLLTPDRLRGTAAEVRGVAALPDPIAETLEMTTMSNGLKVGKRRVPLGVIASIYESRPHVTIDISALSIKSGNACLLRGGKESLHSNA
ncbi:MAG TPA: gamma-glutamyl-phosphate reductase, partial [Dehalococcoidia bacterium]|nr:gamma-glutamyl-phosphate reductase [Dehalococcoidia bacterium]